MDRIKEALEIARQMRGTATVTALRRKPRGAPVPPPVAKPDRIVYNKTRTVTVDADAIRANRIVMRDSGEPASEAYRILCTQLLQRLNERGWNALAVTSPGRGEGKTLTAINLALAMALEVDKTVLLVDADLREPRIHRLLGVEADVGLSDYLQNSVPLERILVHPSIGRFVLLPGGTPCNNSSELLASPR